MSEPINGTVKVEKGIPMPSLRGSKYSLLPANTMEVGDSFICPPEMGYGASVAAHLNRDHKPKRFTSRKISPTERRVWRIA